MGCAPSWRRLRSDGETCALAALVRHCYAYVDNQLDTARRAEVESHLRANPALQRRVEGWRQQAEALRDAMAFKLHEPVRPTASDPPPDDL
jgi:anti-sigma factor RsiW